MKGLLLKDFYMMAKYCRSYLFITVIFIVVSFFSSENLFFIFYPCLLCGMIPVNLLAYDEKSKWLQYGETMPFTRAQTVSSKYLIGLFVQGAVLCFTGISQAVKMIFNGGFQLGEYLILMMLMLILALVSASVSLPFLFKLGVEKGRMAYYIMIGAVCAGSVVSSSIMSEKMSVDIGMNGVLPILCVVGIMMYALSWYLSVVFYKKREIY